MIHFISAIMKEGLIFTKFLFHFQRVMPGRRGHSMLDPGILQTTRALIRLTAAYLEFEKGGPPTASEIYSSRPITQRNYLL